ncbi:hypothetical protein PilKf_01842 [Pillotina sp. SPG140]|jgi:hypothetical protein
MKGTRRNKKAQHTLLSVREALQHVDKEHAVALIDKVNLTWLERIVVIRYELEKESLEAIAVSLHHGRDGNQMYSYSYCATVKQRAMHKIEAYLRLKKKTSTAQKHGEEQQLFFTDLK